MTAPNDETTHYDTTPGQLINLAKICRMYPDISYHKAHTAMLNGLFGEVHRKDRANKNGLFVEHDKVIAILGEPGSVPDEFRKLRPRGMHVESVSRGKKRGHNKSTIQTADDVKYDTMVTAADLVRIFPVLEYSVVVSRVKRGDFGEPTLVGRRHKVPFGAVKAAYGPSLTTPEHYPEETVDHEDEALMEIDELTEDATDPAASRLRLKPYVIKGLSPDADKLEWSIVHKVTAQLVRAGLPSPDANELAALRDCLTMWAHALPHLEKRINGHKVFETIT